ncbi:membrane protein, putative [Renibacterium salmoninarum ATCC 33209]|uniref:Membrane protein, putative n=1 Tax=Renibacterium salmoninarum (strain ATCC 33209 / DSM 20767 / JCM 11484 / NBRC 15589 / NCIMB 2235) TaxID=288705 RepID=A9WPU1_RENSM|nr:cytochrome c oxidase assembly protein [Renibacterium salmoninarum]ABY23098.1 membrane protein, putative [Renibacterium salmoninarum ATCC 33209]
MPTLSEFFSTWGFGPWALIASVLLAALYGAGVYRLRGQWPWHRTAFFVVAGLGSYLLISCGFLGMNAASLRWAFAIKLAALLFVVPLLLALGKPIALARASIKEGPFRDRLASLSRWPMKVFGNAIVAPLVGLAFFASLLMPISGAVRMSGVAEGLLTILVPILGLVLILPVTEAGTRISSTFIVLEIFFAFIELLADAIPGILLRLSETVLDGAGIVPGAHPGWFPNPLRDQQLAGDWLWFIAEISDLPILVLMFLRFARTDKRERAEVDRLTDEEMEALSEEHLRRFSNHGAADHGASSR